MWCAMRLRTARVGCQAHAREKPLRQHRLGHATLTRVHTAAGENDGQVWIGQRQRHRLGQPISVFVELHRLAPGL